MNGYELSRAWFDFCFENPELIKPNHTALYFFAIEHCNRMGWKRKFGFPSEMAKDAIGIKSYNTYISTFNDLVEWGFIEVIEKSRNQYSANIIALSKYDKACDKALDKAMIKHATKQHESTVQSTSESIDSINKHITLEPNNLKHKNNNIIPDFEKLKIQLLEDQIQKETSCMSLKITPEFYTGKLDTFISESRATEKSNWKNYSEFKKHFYYWLKNEVQNGSRNHKSKTDNHTPKSIPKPIKQHYK